MLLRVLALFLAPALSIADPPHHHYGSGYYNNQYYNNEWMRIFAPTITMATQGIINGIVGAPVAGYPYPPVMVIPQPLPPPPPVVYPRYGQCLPYWIDANGFQHINPNYPQCW